MHTHINSSAETAYLGCSTLLDCPEAVASANPITYIELQSRDDRRTSKKHNQHPQNLPPFLIAHGDADTAVPYLQSNILYTALQQACSEATLYILEGQGHVFDAILDGPNYPVTTYLHSKKCKFADGSNTTPLTYQTLVDFFGKHLR
jgi:acetyl esterase/lipase